LHLLLVGWLCPEDGPRPEDRPDQGMSFNRSIRHHTLRSDTLLPFFDAIFGVAVTLLAFNIPSSLDMQGQYDNLFLPVLAYCLTGTIIILYWFKMRRLIVVCRFLHVPQLLCMGQAILVICLFPKLSNLVLKYGSEAGSIFLMSRGQVVNTVYLSLLFIFNALCFVFAWSLTTTHYYKKVNKAILAYVLRGQLLGFVLISAMVVAEIFLDSFNNQYIFLVPMVIIVEEVLVASQFSGLRQ
jgi:uncharacterized membrane protein